MKKTQQTTKKDERAEKLLKLQSNLKAGYTSSTYYSKPGCSTGENRYQYQYNSYNYNAQPGCSSPERY